MNILIVSQYFYPEEFRINDIAVELVKRGNNVTVLTGMPNYPKGFIYEGYEKKYYDEYFGVKIYRSPIRPRYKGNFNLFLNYMSFMIKGKKTIRKIKGDFDIIFSYQMSPVFQIIPAIYGKKRYNCNLICYCCDQWPESLKARGLNSGLIFNIIHRWSMKIYSKCDFIINSSPSFVNYNHNINNIPLEKMDWRLQHSEEYPVCNKEKNLDTIDLLYAGNIGKVQNVQDIILAYNELKYKDLYIHIVGDGSDYDECKELVKTYNLESNVKMYGRVSVSMMEDFYKSCDACILTLSGKSSIGNTIPSKLQGYMSAGKTVLAAINGDSKMIIEEAKCGLQVEADDYLKLAELFRDFYENFKNYKDLGRNGRDYYEKYCRLESFVDYLEEIMIKEK